MSDSPREEEVQDLPLQPSQGDDERQEEPERQAAASPGEKARNDDQDESGTSQPAQETSANQIEGITWDSPRGSVEPEGGDDEEVVKKKKKKKKKSDLDDVFGDDDDDEGTQKKKAKKPKKDDDDLFGDDDDDEGDEGFFKGFDLQQENLPTIKKKRARAEEEEDEEEDEEAEKRSKASEKHHKKQKKEVEEEEKKEFANELEEVEYRVRMAKKRKNTTDTQYLQELGSDGLIIMNKAALADANLTKIGKPATNKLRSLKKLEKIFFVKEVLNYIDKPEFLKTCNLWLLPLKAGQLPNLDIRTFVLKILTMFEMDDDQMSDLLKGSKVGNAVMYLLNHPQETFENKKVAKQLVLKWSRTIFNTPGEYNNPGEHLRVEVKKKKVPTESSSQESAPSGSLSFIDENPDENMKYQRARIPVAPVFNYKIRPDSAVKASENKQTAKKGGGETAMSRMKAAASNKSPHALSMSVEGRGLK